MQIIYHVTITYVCVVRTYVCMYVHDPNILMYVIEMKSKVITIAVYVCMYVHDPNICVITCYYTTLTYVIEMKSKIITIAVYTY